MPAMTTPIPADAKQVITAAALEFGTTIATVMKPGRRAPHEVQARARAMNDVANIQIGGRPKYGLSLIAEWFGVARNRVNVYRQRADGYAPRRPPRRKLSTHSPVSGETPPCGSE